jgi:predicted transcriptional regulator
VTKQLSIKLDDELDTRIRLAAQESSISEWMAEAARQRLTREMWEKYNRTADALGINDPGWMGEELAATEQAQRAAR